MQEEEEIQNETVVDRGTATNVGFVTYQGGYSVAGRRTKNEDFLHIDSNNSLWLVSDGVGGAPHGEIVSQVACNYYTRAWNDPAFADLDTKEHLVACLEQTNAYVSELSELLGNKGSGATLTAACYANGSLVIVSVGDSRAYLLRDATLSQVSGNGRNRDDSNIIDQALGYYMELEPEIVSFVPKPADILLICTDGVWSTQDKDDLVHALLDGLPSKRAISQKGNPQRMAYAVVEGSDMSDNATAIVVLFTNELLD